MLVTTSLSYTGVFMLEAIGLLAGFLTTLSFLPQAFKIIQTRQTQSISLVMYSSFVAGVTLWIMYGFMIASTPLILWNVLTFLLAGTVLILKLRFG